MRVESEIKNLELELEQVRLIQHPAVCAGHQKEKAYWQIEVQRTQKAVDLANEMNKVRLIELMISSRYQNSWDLETKVIELSRKQQSLRGKSADTGRNVMHNRNCSCCK
jgi:hypothetical protein